MITGVLPKTLRQRFARAEYNAACALALATRTGESSAHLRHAVQVDGLLAEAASADPDFAGVWQSPEFAWVRM